MTREELAQYFRSLADALEGTGEIDYIATGYATEPYIKVMKRGDVEDASQVPVKQPKHKKVETEPKFPEMKDVTTPFDEAKGRQVLVGENGNLEVTVTKGGNK